MKNKFCYALPLILGISLGSIQSCSTGPDDLENRRSDRGALLDGEDNDSLVLPQQTTGSFLTMNCKWKQRYEFAESKIACRFEGENGIKSYSDKLSVSAFDGNSDITTKTELMPVNDFWNSITTIPGKYTSGVDIAYFLSGKEKGRQSVDMLLLKNKGIKSVRQVDKIVELDKAVLDVGAAQGGNANGASSVLDAFTGVLGGNGGFQAQIPRIFSPETLCAQNGDNLMITDELEAKYPTLEVKDPDHTKYYWDPYKYYKAGLRSAGIPAKSLDGVLGNLPEQACEGIRNDVGDTEFIGSRCNQTPETQLAQPILNSKGFCLKSYDYFKVNINKNVNYCDVAVFEKPSDDGLLKQHQYIMAFGNDRLAEIISDLKANSKKEAVKMYLDSFIKCSGYESTAHEVEAK